MATEKSKDQQSTNKVNINDLPQSTPAADQDAVKGGMIRRGGDIGTTDPDDDEIGGGE